MLLTRTQIEGNLRRTAEKGLISLLNKYQLEQLALKYFGVYENEQLIGYQCPYSGEIITNFNDIVLEHIIPVSSNGGTVLFNCIPTSKEVNGAAQKGAKHLIEWWNNSSYWTEQAPIRLEKLLNYMLEAYELVFREYTIEEVENSYLEIEPDEAILEEEDNLTLDERTESQLSKQTKNNGIHSYLGFILDCITTLEKNNINTTSIKEKLANLEEQNIFKDIEKYQLYQNIIKQLIISRTGDNNGSYLSYTINFDIKKLINSINLDNQDDIYNELDFRLKNIEQLLSSNNLSIVEYFKSLRDISNIDIIYKNIDNISKEDINIFLENIKIGIDTKTEIFINMLNKGNENILSQKNKENFEGYPNLIIGYFFQDRKQMIIHKLFEELKEDSRYNLARKIILNYYKVDNIEEYYHQIKEKQKLKNNLTKEELKFRTNLDLKIKCFIEMLNKGNSNILIQRNNEIFEGYNNTPVGKFWSHYKEQIIKKLYEELKNDSSYDIARNLIDKFLFENDINQRIDIFINMLNKGNSNILNANNEETFEGYSNIKIGQFWFGHKDEIIKKLYEELKDDSSYDIARNLIDKFLFENDINRKIDVFIEMLNKGNSNILQQRNNESFSGYSNIPIGTFWNRNRELIIKKLFEELKTDTKYNIARKVILDYCKVNKIEELYQQQKEHQEKKENLTSEEFEFIKNKSKRIDCFIEMLNKGNGNILNDRNNESFSGFENIRIGSFWQTNRELIIKKLYEELKEDSSYDIARNLIDEFLFKNDINRKIDVFIEMLNKENANILNANNKENFDGYPNIKIGRFWFNNRELITKKLYEELKDDSSYDIARNLIDKFLFENDINQRIDIFINMLNKGNSNILNANNEETFEGHSKMKIGKFWFDHKDEIIKKLYEELKEDSSYGKARNLIDKFLFENDTNQKIDIFIEMLNKGNSNILNANNEEIFEGYSNIKIGKFWFHHQDKIKKKLYEELKEDSTYDIARNLISTNEMKINIDKQISIFINMLNKGNNKILKRNNKETLEGYPNISLTYFWNSHQNKIKQKLFEELKDEPKYDIARKNVAINEVENSIDKKITIFIDMLNEGNSKILKQGNKETLEGYPSINLATFWNSNKDKIKQKLFIELKNIERYNHARKTVLTYFKVNSYEELEEKAREKKKVRELKKVKKSLEEVCRSIDEQTIIEQRKRA